MQLKMKKAVVIIVAINLLRMLLIPFINKLSADWLPTPVNIIDETQSNSIMQYLVFMLGQNNYSKYLLQALMFLISLLTQWSLFIFATKVIRSDRKSDAWIAISSTLAITLISVLPFADGLIALSWTLSLLSFYNAIFNNDKKSWLLSGMFMGFTCLIKLSGIALPIGLLVFLIFSSRFRHFLFKPGPYISISIAALISLPIWTGSLQNESSTLAISFAIGFFNKLGYSFNTFTSFILFQFLLIFPILYAGLWWVAFKYLTRIFNKPNQINPELWFLLSFFLPLFFGFHLIALFDWVDMFGLIPIYLTGLIVFLKLSKPRWFKVSLIISIVFHLFFLITVFIK